MKYTIQRLMCSLPEDPEPRTWVEFSWNRDDPDISIAVSRGDDKEDDVRVCFIPAEELIALALRIGSARLKRRKTK